MAIPRKNKAEICTYPSRTIISLLRPKQEQIHLCDIAHGLSNICRWGGHIPFYSVAEHCVLMAQAMLKDDVHIDIIRQGHMHDAAEANLGDVVTPLKQRLIKYKAIERRMRRAIFKRFGLPLSVSPIVWEYDAGMLACESEQLLGEKYRNYVALPTVKIMGWAPQRAEKEFLKMAALLRIQ